MKLVVEVLFCCYFDDEKGKENKKCRDIRICNNSRVKFYFFKS
jgi:hypothetical protein